MRKIVYGAAIAISAIVVAAMVIRQPHRATASQFMADHIVDVHALMATIDVKALPKQDIRSEADE